MNSVPEYINTMLRLNHKRKEQIQKEQNLIMEKKQKILLSIDKSGRVKTIVEMWEAQQAQHKILSKFHVKNTKIFLTTCANIKRFGAGTLYNPTNIGAPKYAIIPGHLQNNKFPKFTPTDFKETLITFLTSPNALKKISLNEFLAGNTFSKSFSPFLATKYASDEIPKNNIPLCPQWVDYMKMWWGDTTSKKIKTKMDVKNILEYLTFHLSFFKDYTKPGMVQFNSDPYKELPPSRFALFDVTAPAIKQKWKPETIDTGLLRQPFFHTYLKQYTQKQGVLC